MKMNNLFKQTSLVAAMALTLSACGGGSTDLGGGQDIAGIGGSGFVSSGTITGFGSVIVNGVRFNTDSAEFNVEGDKGAETDLDLGMIVQVQGTINSDGTTGTATAVYFDDELQGPITEITAVDAISKTRSFKLLGTTVIIDNNTTFDIDEGIPTGTTFNLETIKNDNNVEISGLFNADGALIATRVELKDITFDTASIVEIEGKVSELTATGFKIGNINIDNSNAKLDSFPSGTVLANGQKVEVEGTFNAQNNTLSATEIEYEDYSLPDTEEIEIEGIVTDFTDSSSFKVNGISVNAANAIFEDGAAVAGLKDNLHIEVEGKIVNGVLIAEEIEFEDGNIEVHAKISSIDVTNNSFKLQPFANSAEITVSVSYGTQFEDEVNDNSAKTFNINNLVVGNFVEVEGKTPTANGFKANYVTVEEQGEVIIQGYVQAYPTTGGIKVLGVTFSFDNNTEFKDASGNDVAKLRFKEAAVIGTLVSIKDENSDGIAEEAEVETED